MTLESLLEMPEIISIRNDKEFFYPAYTSALFNWEEISRQAFANLTSYLDSPYIIDIFESHNDRRSFRNRLFNSQRVIYEKNALKLGTVNIVSLAVQVLIRTYKDEEDIRFKELAKRVIDLTRNCFKDETYDSLKIDEKIENAYRLKEKIIKLLNYLDVKVSIV
jgi:adenine-specific DNA methylase